jgi:hypothetical protein
MKPHLPWAMPFKPEAPRSLGNVELSLQHRKRSSETRRENSRIKRAYGIHLKAPRGLNDASIDVVAAAIHRFEETSSSPVESKILLVSRHALVFLDHAPSSDFAHRSRSRPTSDDTNTEMPSLDRVQAAQFFGRRSAL